MGIVRFSAPAGLIRELVEDGSFDVAVETGTYKAEGTLLLRRFVSRVWTIELSDDLYRRASVRHGDTPGLTFLRGASADVLPTLVPVVREPAIFWLDAHGGMTNRWSKDGIDPPDPGEQCPVMEELAAIREFRCYAESCILIDDARAFLGPLPTSRAGSWPTLPELVDALRLGCDRHISILDDVVIAVPSPLRQAVDRWWLDQIQDRQGRDGYEQALWEAYNPGPRTAARQLVKSLVPAAIRRMYDRYH